MRECAGACEPQVMRDLVGLTAQPDNDGGTHVGVRQHAGQSSAQLLGVGTDGMPAALAVRKRHNAIDVGRQGFTRVAGGNRGHGVRGAIGSGHYGDVVARAGAAIFPGIAEKRGDFARRNGQRTLVRGEIVIESNLLKREIVRMDVSAEPYIRAGAPNHLAIAAHRLAGGNGPQGDLVAGRNRLQHGDRHATGADDRSGSETHSRDRHIVGGVQSNRRVFRGRRRQKRQSNPCFPFAFGCLAPAQRTRAVSMAFSPVKTL